MPAAATSLPSTAAAAHDPVASFVPADPVPVAYPAAGLPAAVPVVAPVALAGGRRPARSGPGAAHTVDGGRQRTLLLTAAAAVLAYTASAAAGSLAVPAAPPPGTVAAASDGTGSSLDRYVDQLLFRRCHPDWSPVSSCPRPHQHRGRAAEEHATARRA